MKKILKFFTQENFWLHGSYVDNGVSKITFQDLNYDSYVMLIMVLWQLATRRTLTEHALTAVISE